MSVLGWGAILLLGGCSPGATLVEPTDRLPTCTFTNPVAKGADPWVLRHEGSYLTVQSTGSGIYVYRSDKLTELHKNGERVWTPPPTGWNRTHVWAPELHHIDGHWYIYYAAGEDGPPFIHQRSGVLESVSDDPQGAFVDRGMLYTGDEHESGTRNKWAIDLTVTRLDGQLYALWSGWEENRSTDRTPQHLYIAEMSNPWTISSDRRRLASPTADWERGTELDLIEGPQILRNDDDVFVIYSTRESWLPDYRLGQLRLWNPADPMDPASYTKSGPVFVGTSSVYGVGHASFTVSPDSTEDWIVYHSKTSTSPGWDRVIRMQPFGWKSDGSPAFGVPVPSGEPIPLPSGQCEQE